MTDESTHRPADDAERQHDAGEFDVAGVPVGPRARQLLTLEFGDRKDFDDPTHVEHLGATLPALHSLGR